MIYVTHKSAWFSLGLVNAQDIGSLKGKSSCHYEADIAGAQDYAVFTGKLAQDVYVVLCRSCCQNACWSGSVDCHLSCGSLSAAGGKDKAFALNLLKSAALNEGQQEAFTCFFYSGSKGERSNLYICFLKLMYKSCGIFTPGKLLTEAQEAEAVVDALLKHASQSVFSFYEKDPGTLFICGKCGCKSCRAAADYGYVVGLYIFIHDGRLLSLVRCLSLL